MPLSVIVAITALKDMFEDLKRHKSDNEENNRKVSVFRNGAFMEACWKDLRVGEVIKVQSSRFIFITFYSAEKKRVFSGRCADIALQRA